jgi:hypothetical protein
MHRKEQLNLIWLACGLFVITPANKNRTLQPDAPERKGFLRRVQLQPDAPTREGYPWRIGLK